MSVLVFVNAIVMLLFAAFMLVVAIVFPATAPIFLKSFFFTGSLGLILAVVTHGPINRMNRKETFILTSTVWLVGGVAGALPLILWQMSPVDAIFESISGLTTTGATVLSGLDTTPRGILFWRALLQGFGGVGFIVTGMVFLPILRTGGMQLFRTESSDKGDKEMTTATRFAGATLGVYVGLIVLCAIVYHIGGMGIFDAVTHSLTTLSTGGYSNYDASFGHFTSPFLQWAATFFMLLGGLPFAWYIRALYRGTFASEQVWILVKVLAVVILVFATYETFHTGRNFFDMLRAVAFNVVSVVTTTGYATEDYLQWGSVAAAAFFFLTAMGACTGSTAGGAKMMRWIIFARATLVAIKRIHNPHGVFTIRYEGRKVTDDVLSGVVSFFMFYFLTVVVSAITLGLSGLDFQTALSGSLTAIANVGPGVGPVIGPAGNFAPLDDFQKIVLTFDMYVGRLEMLTVYVLFSRAFWREF